VLKQKVGRWLMQREEILGFCQAQRADGGSGAMMVLLKGTSKKAQR
jgi:DNA-nicking Smr family endonuclease